MKKLLCLMCLLLWFVPNVWAEGTWSGKHDGADKAKSCQYHAKRMQQMDQNKDGQVTKEEFLAAAQQRAEKSFAKKDKNADGVLSESDRKPSAKKVERFFERHDANKDGLVSKEEMLGQNKK